MGLEKIAGKLDEYYTRLESGKASRIKVKHVQKVIAKLQSKRETLQAELRDAEKASKKERLEKKLFTADKQIERAEWLLEKIGS